MKKPKNKFIIGVIFLIVAILFSQIFRAYSSSNVDTNTYLSLVKGKASINERFIPLSEQQQLMPGDTVRTIGKDALAVVEWGDGSITRLGGNTKISVGNNEVSRDFTRINISFDLIAGKTWSNVVSFISSDSSFTQNFAGVEAGVRGTVFDVDLEKLFVNVTSHQVLLKDTEGNELLVSEDNPFSLESLTFLSLTDFLQQFQDTGWEELNIDLDNDQLGELTAEIETYLSQNNPFSFLLDIFSPQHDFLSKLASGATYEDLQTQIETFNGKQRASVHDSVLSKYQKLNFVDSSDTENYDLKILYKRLLISLSNDDDKQRLVETSLYDFKDTISSQNIPGFNETMKLLNDNKDILKTLDIEKFLGDMNLIPDDLEKILIENFQDIQDFVEGGSIDVQDVDFSEVTNIVNESVGDFGNNLSDTEKQAKESIEKGLDSIFESFAN